MRGAGPARKRAARVGWPTAQLIQSANALGGRQSDTVRWRWELPVPFPTNFGNSPKKICDHQRERRCPGYAKPDIGGRLASEASEASETSETPLLEINLRNLSPEEPASSPCRWLHSQICLGFDLRVVGGKTRRRPVVSNLGTRTAPDGGFSDLNCCSVE